MKTFLYNLIQNIKFNKINNKIYYPLGRWNSVRYNKNKQKIINQYSEWGNMDNCYHTFLDNSIKTYENQNGSKINKTN
jgi:hypothetical protein